MKSALVAVQLKSAYLYHVVGVVKKLLLTQKASILYMLHLVLHRSASASAVMNAMKHLSKCILHAYTEIAMRHHAKSVTNA
jgi:hypothetical protein